MKKTAKIASSLLMGICSVGLLCVILGEIFGYSFRIVLSGSMEPAISPGSLCVIQKTINKDNLKEGDIIVFRKGDKEVTHRITACHEGYFTTKGDANKVQDYGGVPKNEVLGKNCLWIPYLGTVFLFLKSGKGIFFMIIIWVILLMMEEIPNKKGGVTVNEEIQMADRDNDSISVSGSQRICQKSSGYDRQCSRRS